MAGRRAGAENRITVTVTTFHLLRAERTATFCPLLARGIQWLDEERVPKTELP
jgi:hypothetical protein